MTVTRRRILEVHYRALGRQLTMTQIAQAVGWKSYSSANSHYGRLAKLVGEQVGFRHHSCHLFTLCTFVRPQEKGDHWLIIMRAEVAQALKSLGWFEAGRAGDNGAGPKYQRRRAAAWLGVTSPVHP